MLSPTFLLSFSTYPVEENILDLSSILSLEKASRVSSV